ncbi:hypothetical protein Q5424_13010 [Conexibacter sp. JD483]|uniref:VOC family protein n=1 Tax=unclassified Conexibacter TaxID=2627773 RepID=UPI00271F0514|nr:MULTISPECIES: hypothetical protein [unclassified Conexibacter]MDO8187349.1 hypothetical protein [Conexibacter sp. CPCC 205706]MDO8200518.1 hypothetical protein [Conexibacter sp. CPCC 205762]MDR9370013.1 hypothetical protein [Conexibacter sp. JD483]
MRLVNLAAKVEQLDAAIALLGALPGIELTTVHSLGDDERFAELAVGDTRLNLFESAIHDSARPQPSKPGWLHVSYLVDDLAATLADRGWSEALLWGPEEIRGSFGRRRIAFLEPLPGICVELMEELPDDA